MQKRNMQNEIVNKQLLEPMYLDHSFSRAGLDPPFSPACHRVVGASLPLMEGGFLTLSF